MAGRVAEQGGPRRVRFARFETSLPYLLLIPAAVALAGVTVGPLYQGVEASITRYVFGRPLANAGLQNYANVFSDATFWDAMAVTARFVAVVLVLETVLGLALALLVQHQVRFVRFFRMSIIAPMCVAPVAVGVIWRLMYESQTGAVDPLFVALGLPAPGILANPATAFWGVVFVDVWEWTPLLFLMCLAGLQSIPQEPIEAAVVDGAGPFRVFWEHTLPLLLPVLSVGIVLRLIDAIGTFDQIFVLTRGGPGTTTQLVSIYAYNTAFNFNQYGHGAAMMVTLFLVVLALMMVAVRLMRGASRITR